jgi:EmrB/QacA subfamily drug resistance transporter
MQDKYIENKAGQNWLISLVCIGAFIVNLDTTIVNISLPVISEEFNVSPSVVSWIILAYLVCETGFMLPFGRLADMKGIRRTYLAGFIIFLVGSFLCGISQGFGGLLAFRAVQGIGGAMIFTVMLAFFPIHLPPDMRPKAIGFATAAAAAGVGLGPPIGGWITAFIGWRWIFFVNVPICIASILAIKKYIPSVLPATKKSSFDYIGSFCSLTAMILFLFSVNMGRELGWNSPIILSCFALFLIMLVAFCVQERRIAYPLMDFALFRDRNILFPFLAFNASMMTVGGVLFLFPFYLQEFRGLNPHVSGMIMMPIALGQFVGPFSGVLTGRFGVIKVCIAGLLLGCLSFILFLFLDENTPVLFIVAMLCLFGFAQGIGKAPNLTFIMNYAPTDKRGLASSLITLSRSLAVALGVLFFETVFSDSIPHFVSAANIHISNGVSQVGELHQGFLNTNIFGIFISVLAAAFMFSVRTNKSHQKKGGE